MGDHLHPPAKSILMYFIPFAGGRKGVSDIAKTTMIELILLPTNSNKKDSQSKPCLGICSRLTKI
jgi:hypothetical protein